MMKRSELNPRRRSTQFLVDPSGPSDDALLAGMAMGDDQSAVVFVRRYQRRVFGLAVSILGDRAAAEDAAQEALLRAWRHAFVFDGRRGSVESWLLTITRNVSIDALRKRRSVATDPDEIMTLAQVSHAGATEDAVTTRMTRPAIVAALEMIPHEQRRAVLLAAINGHTAQEVSEIESIPLGTAKTRIRAGLLKLRELLENEDVGQR